MLRPVPLPWGVRRPFGRSDSAISLAARPRRRRAVAIGAARLLPLVLLVSALVFLGACAEIQNLRLITRAQQRRIDELQDKLDKKDREHLSDTRKMQIQFDAAQEQLRITREELRKAQTQRTKREIALEKENRETARELQAKKTDLTRAEKRIGELSKEVGTRNGEIQTLRAKQTELEGTITSQTTALAKAGQDKKTLLEEVEGLKLKVSFAERKAEEQGETIESLQNSLADAKSSVAEMQKKLSTETTRADRQDQNVRNLAVQIEKLQEKLRAPGLTSSTLAQTVREEKLALEKEAARLQDQIRRMEAGEKVLDSDFEEALNLLRASLKPYGDADLTAVTSDPRGVIVRLRSDFLFEKGAITLDPNVLPVLNKIAEILARYPKKYVEIQGHTDSQPILNLPFADNWALASARADSVVRYLADEAQTRIAPERLKSTSCAQYRPPKGNSPKPGKMLRRVEIILTNSP